MKTTYILTILSLLLITQGSIAHEYTWIGADTVFAKNSNWSSATGSTYPGSGDTAIIVSATHRPVLATNKDVYRLVVNSGSFDLKSYTFTSTGSAVFSGGTLTNGSLVLRGTKMVFTGTQFDVTLDVLGDNIALSGGIFNESCIFTTTGLNDSKGNGGCVFNDDVMIVHTGTLGNVLRMAKDTGDQFNGDLILINMSNGPISLSEKDSTFFNGNVELNNMNTGLIYFGYFEGYSELASGKTISVGDSGFYSGQLYFKHLTQKGATAQTLTLTDSSGFFIKECVFEGNLTITAPDLLCSFSTFSGTTQITKTNTSGNYWYGNNTFNGPTTINYEGTGGGTGDELRLTDGAPNIYYDDVAFESSGNVIEVVPYNGSEFHKNVFINNGTIYFIKGITAFKGSGAQELNGSVPYEFEELVIDKTAGNVTLNTPVSITGYVEFTSGNIISDTTNLITFQPNSAANGAHNGSFVNGPVKKVGDTKFEFPVGKGNDFRPIGISEPDSITDTFVAEYLVVNDQIVNSGLRDSALGLIERSTFWNLYRESGGSEVYVILSWNEQHQLNDTNIAVAVWNGTLWKNLGNDELSGDTISGNLRSAQTTNYYSQFAIGYISNSFLSTAINCNSINSSSQLISCLDHAGIGDVLSVTNDIYLASYGGIVFPLEVSTGVTLQGHNGINSPGWWEPGCPVISSDHRADHDNSNLDLMFLFSMQPGSNIQNLRIRGANCSFQDYNGDSYLSGGIIVKQDGSLTPVEINKTEVSCFSYAGIFKLPTADYLSIKNCYIHKVKGNGKTTGIGYGTWMQGNTDLTQVAYNNNIFDDCKAGIDGQGYPMNWVIDKCSFTQFFHSEDINKHNDNRFKIYDADDNVPFDYHFCYDNNSCGSSCFYGIHCTTFLPCTTATCTSGYITSLIGCTASVKFPIYDVGGTQTDVTSCIFHKNWLIGSKQSNINVPFPNRDPSNNGNINNGISVLNNTFVTKQDAPLDMLNYDNRGGYARIADNYIEACVWNGDAKIDFSSLPNYFNYKVGLSTSTAPQPSELQLELFDSGNNLLSNSFTKSSGNSHQYIQYLDVNESIKISTNPGIQGGQNLTYIIRPNPNVSTGTLPLLSYENYFFNDEVITENNLTTLPAYDKPGLYGIDVIAFDATGGPNYDFKASAWQHIPVIVKSSDNKKLYFNIKDSYYEFPGMMNTPTNVFKRAELNGEPIWQEDIATGGNGWEYIEVNLDGNILGTSNPILGAINTNGEPNVLSFSIVIDQSTSIPVTDLRGLLVWVDDIYIKKFDSPVGDNLLMDGSIELSAISGLSAAPTPESYWYYANEKTFTGCNYLRMISGANGEDDSGEFDYYADGSRVAVYNAPPKTSAAIGISERRSGNQALVLKIPALKTCTNYDNNGGSPLISVCTNFEYSDLVGCSDYYTGSTVPLDFELFPSTYTGSPTYTDKKYKVNSNITLNSGNHLTLEGCVLAIASGITITVNNGATLEILNSTNSISSLFACEDMWNGIVVNSGGYLKLWPSSADHNEIKDAVFAIESNGGRVEVRFTDFDHNYSSMDLSNAIHVNSKVYGCNFRCSGGAITRQPHFGNIPAEHIRLENISNFTFPLGDPTNTTGTGKRNYFSDAFHAITSVNSKVDIKRNTFINIYNINNQQIQEIGSAVNIMNNNTAVNLSVNIGGVYDTGLNIDETNTYIDVNIGIKVYNGGNNCNFNIVGNTITNTNYVNANASGNYTNTGITVQSPRGIGLGSTQIFNNTVTDCRVGIHAINNPGILVGGWDNGTSTTYGNNINFSISPGTLNRVHNGIWLQSCGNAKVVKNLISNSEFSNENNFRGIDIASSPNCDVNCNEISNTGIALNFYANCNLTKIRRNILNNYGSGIMLAGPNGASIDFAQGGSGDAWDNEWNPNVSSNLKVDGMLFGINTFINWYHKGSNSSGIKWSPNPWNGNIINAFENQASGSLTCDDFSRYAVNRVANFGSIVGDSANYGTDSLATRYQSRLEAYKAMLNDSTIIYQSDSLDSYFMNFYNTIDSSNIGRFNKVIELATTYPDSAAYLNSIIISVGETEILLKAFYSLYFDKILDGDTLSPADSSNLEYLALLSRSAYGGMVHDAAATLFYEAHPDETSPRLGSNSLTILNAPNEFATTDIVMIFPNPARDAITVKASSEMKNIQVFNAYGSLMINVDCTDKIKQVELNGLLVGIYFVKTELRTDKSIISKFVILK